MGGSFITKDYIHICKVYFIHKPSSVCARTRATFSSTAFCSAFLQLIGVIRLAIFGSGGPNEGASKSRPIDIV